MSADHAITVSDVVGFVLIIGGGVGVLALLYFVLALLYFVLNLFNPWRSGH